MREIHTPQKVIEIGHRPGNIIPRAKTSAAADGMKIHFTFISFLESAMLYVIKIIVEISVANLEFMGSISVGPERSGIDRVHRKRFPPAHWGSLVRGETPKTW